MSTDSSLPRLDTGGSCRRGPESFDEFYRGELPRLVVFVRNRMRATWEEAADAAQDALVAALVHWEEITNPRAWVRVTAERKFLRHQLRSRQGTELARRPGWGVSGGYASPAVCEETEMVLEAIKWLPPAQRRVMAWYFDGYAPAEIAGILGEDAPTVRSNLRHARRRLAEALAVPELVPPGGMVSSAVDVKAASTHAGRTGAGNVLPAGVAT
jgi:DNA-directed RNA polymerase specialized sigma24 family protein